MVLVLLAGCAQHIDVQPTNGAVQGFAPWSDAPAPHRLVAGDEIELKFLLNNELNDKLMVGPDGRVTVPLLGPITAQGQTVEDFTKSLETAYAPKLRVPKLDVIMRNYGAARIYVGGEVKTPGVLAMAGQMDVLQGVVAAGGILPSATLEKIVVIRRRADHTPMMRTVDLRGAIGHADARDDFPLQAADVIYVPKSGIAEFDMFVEQYLNAALPFQKNVTANIGQGYF
jgi:protein involved in polysaccharide export with SLBB domain